MRDGKLLSVFTRPFRTYRFWQCYYFYAEVDVKNLCKCSDLHGWGRAFLTALPLFLPSSSNCENPVNSAVTVATFQTEASNRNIQMFSHRCTLMCCLFFFFFPSLPSYPSVTTTALKLQPSFLLASRASISAAWFVLLWTLKSETNLENLESASQQWK